jgi:hypothetical protein
VTHDDETFLAFGKWVIEEAARLKSETSRPWDERHGAAAPFDAWARWVFDWSALGSPPGPMPRLPYLPTEGFAALGARKFAPQPAALPSGAKEMEK